MQSESTSSTPSIDSFLHHFSVDMLSTEGPSLPSGQAQVGHSFSVMKLSDIGSASVEGIVPPSQMEPATPLVSSSANLIVIGVDSNAGAQAGLVTTDQNPQIMQDSSANGSAQIFTSCSFPPYEAPSEYSASEGPSTAATSSCGVWLSNSGQSHTFYDQQGPSDPSGYALHHYTQANNGSQLDQYTNYVNVGLSAGPSTLGNHSYSATNLPSEQFRSGDPSALVVISGAPSFEIPLLLANALRISLPANRSSVGLSSSGPTFFDQQGPSVPNGLHHYTQANNDLQLNHYTDYTNFASVGPVPPNGHNYTYFESSLPSEQSRSGGPSALVVIPEAPSFNIPLHLANALHECYHISEA